MSMFFVGALFFVVFFSSLFFLHRIVWKRAVERPVAEGLAKGSPVAGFTDDLLRHKWPVVIALAVLVFLDKTFHAFGGVMESRWVIAGVVVVIFGARQVMGKG
jgi:hypothetical protein